MAVACASLHSIWYLNLKVSICLSSHCIPPHRYPSMAFILIQVIVQVYVLIYADQYRNRLQCCHIEYRFRWNSMMLVIGVMCFNCDEFIVRCFAVCPKVVWMLRKYKTDVIVNNNKWISTAKLKLIRAKYMRIPWKQRTATATAVTVSLADKFPNAHIQEVTIKIL